MMDRAKGAMDGLSPDAGASVGAHPWLRREVIGDAELYLGDCREIAPHLDAYDGVVTDPPYGQRHKVNTFQKGGTRSKAVVQRGGSVSVVYARLHPEIAGDAEAFDTAPLMAMIGERPAIVWGAHKFADRMPPGSWLVWDKVPTGKVRSQGDGEAAWTSLGHPMRIHRLLWDGLCVGAAARHEVTAGVQRVHPTQKPEALMAWCIGMLPTSVGCVLDPYMGSGSTGVAAVKAGLRFIGCEVVPEYFDIACQRIERAQRQLPLGV